MIWFLIMIPCSALFTGIGIFAMRRKKPMWFWSGSEVRESEIRDVPAYNRANGWMWIFFSCLLWFSTFIGLWSDAAAAIAVGVTFLVGLPSLIVAYNRIYRKYRA